MSHDTVLYIPVPASSPDFIHWPYPHFTSFSTAPHVACGGQLLCQSTSCFLFHLPSVITYQTTENLGLHPISWIFQSQLREDPNPLALHPYAKCRAFMDSISPAWDVAYSQQNI